MESKLKTELTKVQRETLEWLLDYFETSSCPPSYREIQEGLGLRSINPLQLRLDKLEQHGYISRVPNKARSLMLTPKAQALREEGEDKETLFMLTVQHLRGDELTALPMLSGIERVCGDKSLWALIVDHDRDNYAIAKNDCLIMQPYQDGELRHGDIVVVEHEDKVYLRCVHLIGDRVAIENIDTGLLEAWDGQIVAKAIGLWRNFLH